MRARPSQGNAEPVSAGHGPPVLLCQVGLLVCALPLESVSETLRPMRFEPLADTAPFVLGVSIIRGRPVPVVDLARLLGNATDEVRTRFVSLKIGERSVALAVGRVIGVRSLDASLACQMPPLLGGASAEVIATIGSLDAGLLLFLETSKMLPDFAWASLKSGSAEA